MFPCSIFRKYLSQGLSSNSGSLSVSLPVAPIISFIRCLVRAVPTRDIVVIKTSPFQREEKSSMEIMLSPLMPEKKTFPSSILLTTTKWFPSIWAITGVDKLWSCCKLRWAPERLTPFNAACLTRVNIEVISSPEALSGVIVPVRISMRMVFEAISPVVTSIPRLVKMLWRAFIAQFKIFVPVSLSHSIITDIPRVVSSIRGKLPIPKLDKISFFSSDVESINIFRNCSISSIIDCISPLSEEPSASHPAS